MQGNDIGWLQPAAELRANSFEAKSSDKFGK
jgi:hypothetical protein